MRATPSQLPNDVFSIEEVALAARVADHHIRELVEAGGIVPIHGFLKAVDAVRILRALGGGPAPAPVEAGGLPRSLLANRRRRGGLSLAMSGALHVLFLALLAALTSLGLFNAGDTEQLVLPPSTSRLVYLMSPGPGGGGGGGGLQVPTPPPPAQRKAPPKPVKKVRSPIPPVRKTPAPTPRVVVPPRPAPPPPPSHIEPLRTEPRPTPPPVVAAPVVPEPSDPVDLAGTLSAPPAPAPPSNGPGTGGGVGSGAGTGVGEGQGSGIGPGSGGGTGGGPYQPGSGIDPPQLLREVRPGYTDEARRRSIEGDVKLEIVVRHDGSVGNVRVLQSLGAGLEQKAVDAVRQWQFSPAHRHGQPVDVVVQVSVEFSLR
jgi:periplasmic protein TonB